MKNENHDVPIKDLDITVRAKNVLTLLNIKTLGELYTMYIVGTIPKVGTVVNYVPFARVSLVYSNKVNEEVKQLLNEYFFVEMDDLKNVGVH